MVRVLSTCCSVTVTVETPPFKAVHGCHLPVSVGVRPAREGGGLPGSLSLAAGAGRRLRPLLAPGWEAALGAEATAAPCHVGS